MVVSARLERVVELLFPPDPGALRLLAALRATLAGVLTFAIATLLGGFAGISTADRILGFAMALFIAATVRDGQARQRLVTMALAPLAAFGMTVLATLLLDQPLPAALAVPVLMFAVAYGSSVSPRYGSLGTVGLIAYFIALVSRMPPDTLPGRLLVVVVAAGAAAFVRFVLMPESPQAELTRLRRAIQGTIVQVLDTIGTALASGAWSNAGRATLRQRVFRLGDVVMLAQARVAAIADAVPGAGSRWLHLLLVELATERVARTALRSLGGGADRSDLLARIAAVQHGTEMPAQPPATPLGAALTVLGSAIHDLPKAELVPATAPAPSQSLGLRAALQTAIAAALAIAAGEMISPNRWYWAAFTAFVMFQGTRSRGESIAKGIQFMVGTLAGVLAGMLAATLLSGHELLMIAAIIVAVFLAFQANVAAYGVMVFWITIILGLLFGAIGYFPPDLLLLRLQESAVGAASGALVACLVLVRGERSAVQNATSSFLAALRLTIGSAVAALTGDAGERGLAGHIVTAEQRFHELSVVARTGQLGLAASRDERLRRRVLLMGGAEHWARELGQMALQGVRVADQDLAQSMRETAAAIDTTLICLLERTPQTRTAPPQADDQIDPEQVLEDDPVHHALRLLLRIDAALLTLASRSAGPPQPA
ncbi:MAG: FUSC family protein [Acetobacteraceae bacterium]